MRAVSMCYSMLQDPSRICYMLKGSAVHRSISLTSVWHVNFNTLESAHGRNCSLKPLGANTSKHSKEGLPSRSCIARKGISGDVEYWVRATEKLKSDKSKVSKFKIPDEVLAESVNLKRSEIRDAKDCNEVVAENVNVNRSEATEDNEYCDVQEKIEGRGVQRLVTIFVFDIETTGLSRDNERIIELALRDLNGGENSTFQTLINPERDVPNAYIHGITTKMVRRPSVPRFKDLIPILRKYVRSRQIPNFPVLLVGHNARSFDIPFLINEFSRCSEEIPSDWLFLDTLSLARDLFKLKGSEGLSGKSLKALREYYEIPLIGKAHRSMSDVHTLSMVLKKMTFDLKLPVSSLLDRSFKASDLLKKKSTD